MKLLLPYHYGWRITGYYPENYFSGENLEVIPYNLQNTPYWTDWSGRLPFFIPKGVPISAPSVLKALEKEVDYIFEIDGGPHHLTGLKSMNAVKAFWSCDLYRQDTQRFHRRLEDDFDVIFVAHKNLLSFFKKKKTVWLPYGCDPSVTKDYCLPKIYDITFVGNTRRDVYPERMKLLDALTKKFKVNIVNGVYAQGAAKIYNQSKIVFNKTAAGEINNRIFEAIACNTLLMSDKLSPDTGLEDLLQDRKHLVFYKDEKELLDLVGYYLSHESERKALAEEGMKEVQSNHTFTERFKTVWKILQGIK